MQKLWELRHNSIVRYGLTGISAFASQYLVLSISYYVFSAPLNVASSLGYIAGLFVSYIFNRLWVFGEAGRHKRVAHQSVQYVGLVIINYCFTVFSISFLDKHGIPPYISQFPITASITIWNYNLFKRVIFKGRQQAEPTAY